MTTKKNQILLGNIVVDVIHKEIKNLHLSVYPPEGKVRISAPFRMNLETIRIFVISKLSWIKHQQEKLRSQLRETPRDYITRESHYYMGRRYLLKVMEHNAHPEIKLKHNTIELYVRPDTSTEKKHELLDEWYRQKLKEVIPQIVIQYEKKMQVQVSEFAVKKMKTKWGSCSIEAKRIWINLELAKKPRECIEYIVVHEMAHLLERRHNDRFISLMNRFLPQWRQNKEELNRLPVSHSEWKY